MTPSTMAPTALRLHAPDPLPYTFAAGSVGGAGSVGSVGSTAPPEPPAVLRRMLPDLADVNSPAARRAYLDRELPDLAADARRALARWVEVLLALSRAVRLADALRRDVHAGRADALLTMGSRDPDDDDRLEVDRADMLHDLAGVVWSMNVANSFLSSSIPATGLRASIRLQESRR